MEKRGCTGARVATVETKEKRKYVKRSDQGGAGQRLIISGRAHTTGKCTVRDVVLTG